MATIKVREIKYALQKKGFVEDVSRDHDFYTFFYNGKKTQIFTKISHGDDEINGFLISKMAGQVKLSNPLFKDLINCPLTEEVYKNILVHNGFIS